MLKCIIFVTALFLPSSAALADGELDRILSAADKARLKGFDSSSVSALSEARAGGSAGDIAVLDTALAGTPLPIEGTYDPTGNWSCRIFKAGGSLPLTVYPKFKCMIADDGAGWVLRKLTGSQRTEGRFFTESATRLVYVGAGHLAGGKPRRYGEDAQQDQVAYAERRAGNRIILLFPEPHVESKLDILVLER